MNKPELLAPAKNLERLKVAISYGADAVYVGGQAYGLRARADNFTNTELAKGAEFAHAHGAKVYVTLNAFLHDEDFDGLDDYCQLLESIGIDAVIVSDLGVMRAVRRSSNLDIHLSTQASCLNVPAAKLWKSLGAKRLILGRELTIAEAGKIRREADIEVEMFIHGAMCMSYSGHCTISNFTAGRDSNRGGCSQSCRFPYAIDKPEGDLASSSEEFEIPLVANSARTSMEPEQEELHTFMSSRDLWGIEQIDQFFEEDICSVKIEGRMKSSFYVATTCKAYRQLIDSYAANRDADAQASDALVMETAAELRTVPNRNYFSGSLSTPAGQDSIYRQLSGVNKGEQQYLGIVVDTTPEQIVLRLLAPLAIGDKIEILPFEQPPIRWDVEQLTSITGESIRAMRQDSVVCLPLKNDSRHSDITSIRRLNVARTAQVA